MITVAILTKNSRETLEKTLDSIQDFPEIILLDTGSTDSTVKIAEGYPNCKIFHSPFTTFGKLRNLAASYATNDWILVLDSDEVLSKELSDEIKALTLQDPYVYSLPFINFYHGKKIKGCGWYPEAHVRLYNKRFAHFDDALVHEGLVLKDLETISLKHPIYHTSYRSIDDFLRKMQLYSSLFAKQNRDKKSSSLTKAIFHGVGAFLKSYLLKRGIFDGKEGFIISFYNGEVAYYKYLKLAEKGPCS